MAMCIFFLSSCDSSLLQTLAKGIVHVVSLMLHGIFLSFVFGFVLIANLEISLFLSLYAVGAGTEAAQGPENQSAGE